MTRAFFPGSFDPMTNGQLDVLSQGLAVAQTVVVGIGIHPGKTPLMSAQQRADLIADVVAEALPGRAGDVSVIFFKGLVVDAARAEGASLLLRGLRDGTDLDYEMQMAGMNRAMAPDIQTVFLPSDAALRPITATLVRQIAAMGGDIAPFVPASVLKALRAIHAGPAT